MIINQIQGWTDRQMDSEITRDVLQGPKYINSPLMISIEGYTREPSTCSMGHHVVPSAVPLAMLVMACKGLFFPEERMAKMRPSLVLM